jgi:acid phosphatase (class A)
MKTFKDVLNEAQVGVLNTSIDINAVNYGNASIDCFNIMQRPNDHIKNWFIEKGLVEKIKSEAPLNDSATTKGDLAALMEKTKKATAEDITFARYVEDISNLAQSFIDLLEENGHMETMGGFFGIDHQTEGLLFFLKDIINRPRPFQLAKYYNYPLYPLISTDAMNASYPSGHALTGFVMSEYYSRKYPKLAAELKALGEKIANSREVTGIHYPSDTAMSRQICNIIFENNLIQ